MAKQIIQPVTGPRTLIRSLVADDLEMTRRWRNHPDTRSQFFHSDEISPSQHADWFQKYQQRDDDYVFIVQLRETGQPFAQTSLYRLDETNRSAEFGRFIVGELSLRGAGYGRESLELTCRLGFELFQLDSIHLEVKPDNAAAIKGYRAVGFNEVTQSDQRLVMRISRQSWRQHANTISD